MSASERLRRAWLTGCELPEETSTVEYLVRDVDGPWLIGVSREGRPALLRAVDDAGHQAGRLVGKLRLRFIRDAAIAVGGQRRVSCVAALECLDSANLDTFTVVAHDFMRRLTPGSVRCRDFSARFGAWRDLLSGRDVLSSQSQLGLWGEIELMLALPNTSAALTAWNGPDGEAIDFVRRGIALEVKTSKRWRQHVLRWSQAVFGEVSDTSYLVSVHAQPDEGGRSLAEQVARAKSLVSDIDRLFTRLLSAGYREDHVEEYRQRWALASPLEYFALKSVPRFTHLPEGVSNVRWEVDLTNVRPLPPEAVDRIAGEFCKEA